MLDPAELLREPLFPILALAFGLVIGSFANVCIYRIPAGRSVVVPGSACPSCARPIAWYDNLPVLSYAWLRARCRHCRAPIAPRYPLVEAANGALYLAIALTSGSSPRALAGMAFATALLVLALIDLDHQILPDAITLPGTALALLASGLEGGPRPLEALLSAAGGFLVFAAIAEVWRRGRGVEALGQGDWKMAALLGAFLGGQQLLLTVFLATLAGSLVGLGLILARRGDSQSKLPLGTFLGFSGILVLLCGEPVLRWYQGFFDV